MSFATATARKISCSESSHNPCLRRTRSAYSLSIRHRSQKLHRCCPWWIGLRTFTAAMATGIMYRNFFQNLFLSPEGIHYLQNLWRILKLHQTEGRVFFVFWACIPMGKGTFGDNTLAYPDVPAVDILNPIRKGQQRCGRWLPLIWQLVLFCLFKQQRAIQHLQVACR